MLILAVERNVGSLRRGCSRVKYIFWMMVNVCTYVIVESKVDTQARFPCRAKPSSSPYSLPMTGYLVTAVSDHTTCIRLFLHFAFYNLPPLRAPERVCLQASLSAILTASQKAVSQDSTLLRSETPMPAKRNLGSRENRILAPGHASFRLPEPSAVAAD